MHGLPTRDAPNRREWLIDGGRITLLGGLAALLAHLGWRSAKGACINTASPCEACGLWNGCQLPKAKATTVAAGRQTTTIDSPDPRAVGERGALGGVRNAW